MLPSKLVLMLFMVAFDPSNEGFLPIDRSSIRSSVDPAFKLSVKRVEVPSRTFLTKEMQGIFGNNAPRGAI